MTVGNEPAFTMSQEFHKDIAGKTRFIFDFDQTIGTLEIDWRGWHFGVGEIFRSFDPTFDAHHTGGKVHALRNQFFRKYGKECRDRVTAFSAEYERVHATGLAVNERVLAVIRGAEHGKLYVWSSNTRQTVSRYLAELGVLGKFEKLVTSDDVHYLKPDPEGFSLIKDGTPLDQYVFFGDSIFDQGAAANASIDYVDVKD